VTGLRHRAAAKALRLRDQTNQQCPDRVICVAPRSWISSSAEPKPPHQPQSRPTTPAHATHRSPATRPELAITSRQPITSSRSGKPLRNATHSPSRSDPRITPNTDYGCWPLNSPRIRYARRWSSSGRRGSYKTFGHAPYSCAEAVC
jgi:hypothetical protein